MRKCDTRITSPANHPLSGLCRLIVLSVSVVLAAAGLRAEVPLLSFGVLSDVHIGAEDDGTLKSPDALQSFKDALRYFDGRKADAVVLAGDMTGCGRRSELMHVGRAWDEVFPANRSADGRQVEKVFIYGNHDPGRWPRINTHGERLVADDKSGAWEEAFHEPYRPIFTKNVKGYDFVCANWQEERKVGDLLAAAGRSGRPFFHVQHPHILGTVYGGGFGGKDRSNAVYRLLESYPQAISFSGHSHSPLQNEQSIWQGGFTAIGTSSLRYVSVSECRNSRFPRGYENGYASREAREQDEGKLMANENYRTDRHEGLFATVYADRVEIERREFGKGVRIGEIWSVPFGNERPYALPMRTKHAELPSFAVGAKLVVKRVSSRLRRGGKGSVDAWELAFPPAMRAYEYRIVGQGPNGQPVESWVYPTVHPILLATDRFAADDIGFTVTPVDSLGNEGRPLRVE